MARIVAIVGVGCRVPGADDIGEFFKLLQNGENHVVEVPKNRWNVDEFYDSDALKPGKTNVRKAGFVEGIEKWDYKFFGINEFESKTMDPQHKLALDCVYMALENAGITKKSIKGSNTGVYIGVMNSDYSGLTSTASNYDNYTVTGTNNSIVSSRINYVFDLCGPSLGIDTACSSSLMAIHQAHQAILSGECDMAIAGGVNLILSPSIFIQLTKAGMLSPTGQSQAFSENADGYARGEGGGIVILKSYEKAMEDNNPIWATISTAANHDGHAVSPITTPSMEQQIQLLDIVFTRFNVDPQSIDYIEAHGTGTKAGDPIEVEALGRYFHTADNNSRPKLLGSVKTNIGHLESAAGVAGLIKVLLMHKHQQIVKSLHFVRPSPDVPLEKYNLRVAVNLQPWPESDRDILRSSVNCFGFGGSNCHAIVTTQKSIPNHQSDTYLISHPKVVCLSAVDTVSLQMIRDSMCENVKDYQLADLSYTSTVRRNHYHYRLAVFGQNTTEIIEKLQVIDINKHLEKYNPTKREKFIFVFAGLGTNWDGMCQKMLKRFSVFRSTFDDISQHLQKYVTWNISDSLKNGFDTRDANVGPIMTFACEVALFDLLKSVGVRPDAIIGQSIGEVAASYASGAVSLEKAVYIIYHRTRVQVQGTGGVMFVVNNIEIEKVQKVLKDYESKANVAVYSSPMGCTISCDENIVGQLKEDITQIDADCILKDLNVTSAFHSHHMDKSSEDMKTCTEINGGKPKIDIYSTVSGVKAEREDFITAQYWANNIRKPVKLYQAVREAYDPLKYNIFVEFGPRPILGAHLPNIFPDQSHIGSIPLMKINDELNCFTEAVCNFYNYGVDVQWVCFDDFKANVVDYPKYKFNRVENMFIPVAAREYLAGVDQRSQNHPFVKQLSSDNVKVFIYPSKLGSIYEHRVNGYVTIPGALYAEVGLALAALRSKCISLREVTVDFITPLILFDRQVKHLDTMVDVHDDQTDFKVFEGPFTFSSGTISTCVYKPVPKINIEDIRNRCNVSKTRKQIYEDLGKFGFTYGKAMSVLDGSIANDREALIELKINDLLWDELKGMILHPAIIDSLLQAPGVFPISETFHILPIQIRKLRVYSQVQRNMLIYVQSINPSSKTKYQFELMLCAESGEPIAGIETLTAKVIGSQETEPQNIFFEPNWFSISDDMHSEKLHPLEYVSISVESRPSQDEEVNCVVPLVDNIEDLNKLKDLLSNYSYVVIHINVDYNETSGGLEIMRAVTDYLLWLKVVLRCIYKVNEQHDIVRVLINLKNTWSIGEINTNSTNMIPENIIHSTLWGGLRSVQMELPTLVIHIVDLHDIKGQTDRDSLLTVFNKLTSDWTNYGELVITGEGVFSYQISYMEEARSETYLSIADNGDIDFKLFSASRDVVQDVFKLRTRNVSLQEKPGLALLHVTKLVFQAAELFPPIADQENNGDGWPIYCLESVGYKPTNERDLLVSCFPVLAANKVMVPRSCCVSLKLIPFYRPGLLSLLVGLWILTSKIKTSRVTILHQERNSPHLRLFGLILRYKKVNYQVLNPKELSSQRSIVKKEEIICLVTLDKLIADVIMENDSICSVISFSSLLPLNLAAILRRRLRQLHIQRINEHDMFSEDNISTVNRGLFEWLKRHKDIKDVMEQFDCSVSSRDPLQALFKVTDIDLQKYLGLKIPIRLTPSRLLNKSSAYIVVGGLTGLGWQCVRWLATHQAGYILIFNRRRPNEEDDRSIEELSSLTCCKIKCYSVDVRNLSAVIETIHQFTLAHVDVCIKGVIHGAGILDDSLLFNMTENTMTTCLYPKILGAWNLHRATMHMNLDFFILHSSVTSILGAPGQSNYGAGNAFQDCLIAVRQKCNLPIQTVNWGPLAMGMLEGEGRDRIRKDLSSKGYNLIDKEEIGMCLETAILSDKHQIIIMKIDLQKMICSKPDKFTQRKLHHILPTASTKGKEIPMPASFDLHSLKDATQDEIPQIIEDYINKLVGRILTDVVISPSTILIEAGMNSMQAMILVNKVNDDIGVKVPLNLLFGRETTVYTLSKLIEENYMGEKISDLSSENPVDVPDDSKITYPELRYLQLNNLETYKAYHNISDLSFDNLPLPKEEVINLFKSMVMRYPICRALFEWKEGIMPERADVTKSFMDAERAVDICEVDPNDPDFEAIFNKRYYEKFDTKSKGPVRFTYAVSDNNIRMSIVFNHVGFDLEGVNLFVRDIKDWLISFQKESAVENLQKPIKITNEVEHEVDVCYILDDILTKQLPQLEKFWRHQIEKGIPVVTMNINQPFRHTKGHACVSEVTLSQETLDMCESSSISLSTTQYKLYVTIYQLLLATRSKTARVVISTTVNLRQYSSKLERQVGCISNHVPLFANMPSPDSTFRDFIRSNSDEINETLDHAIYPYTELVKLIPEGQNKELDMHEMVYHDMTFVNEFRQVAKTAGLGVKVCGENTYAGKETIVKILVDKVAKTTTFKLMLGGENYDQHDADDFLRDFVTMLECVKDPDISIQKLQDKIKGKNG